MPTNDFLPFGNAVGANVMSQADYLALAARSAGFSSGTANSAQLNKAWRQASIMAAMLGQFIVDQSGQNAVDDGTTATLEANLLTAIRAATRQATILTDTGAANAYAAVNAPALTVLPATGYGQRINIANANTGASTYAPDGLAAKPIYGLGLQPLQGGELPAGVAVLMYLVQAGVNGGNGAWIIIESLGGASQVAPATKSQHAVQLGQISGVVGQARNVKMSVAAASATATLTADEIIIETALGGLRYCLSNFNKIINLATTGPGGMDTGLAPVSGFVAIYSCYNPNLPLSSTNPMLLGRDATSAIAPEVYGGANMPAGYTASALVSVWPTNASRQFIPAFQIERGIGFVFFGAISSNVQVTAFTAVSLAAGVPPNAIEVGGFTGLSTTGANNPSVAVASNGGGAGWVQAVTTPTGQAQVPFKMPILAQTIYWTASILSGTFISAQLYISSYKF